jgi:hypothetical protein
VWESFVILCLGFQVLNNFAYDPSDRVSLAGLQTARPVPETWGFTPNRIIFWTFILQGNLTPWSSLLRWGSTSFLYRFTVFKNFAQLNFYILGGVACYDLNRRAIVNLRDFSRMF